MREEFLKLGESVSAAGHRWSGTWPKPVCRGEAHTFATAVIEGIDEEIESRQIARLCGGVSRYLETNFLNNELRSFYPRERSDRREFRSHVGEENSGRSKFHNRTRGNQL